VARSDAACTGRRAAACAADAAACGCWWQAAAHQQRCLRVPHRTMAARRSAACGGYTSPAAWPSRKTSKQQPAGACTWYVRANMFGAAAHGRGCACRVLARSSLRATCCCVRHRCCGSCCRPSVPANSPLVFDVQLLYIPGEPQGQAWGARDATNCVRPAGAAASTPMPAACVGVCVPLPQAWTWRSEGQRWQARASIWCGDAGRAPHAPGC
jgi:hypothetical protein